jgi:bifunctional non-homologous end joining protein LigD
MPHRIRPMLAIFVDKPFDRPGWFFEIKWDGFRAIAEIEKAKVRLYSRNFISFNERYPAIVDALQQLGHEAVLDGEIVVLDKKGKSDFQLLQKYQQTGEGILAYYVFDLLYLDGVDLRAAPLRRRKEALELLIRGDDLIRTSDHIEEFGIAFFKAAVDQGVEGIIAKNASSSYLEGARGRDWLKIKTRQEQEAVIGGFTEPRRSRKELGALVLGVYEGDDLVYVGHSGSGFDAKTLSDVRAKLDPLIQRECPFKDKPKTNAAAHWVKPKLVCQVAFQEWTGDGIMRMPIFLGLRDDRNPREVKRELPQPLPQALSANSGMGHK